MQIIKLTIDKKNNKKKVSPIIEANDLVQKYNQQQTPMEWLQFVDNQNRFLAYGYLGKQNKGEGWLISFDETQPITDDYLISLFKKSYDKRHNYLNNPDTTAFRLFNGEGDGLGGVTVDWYDGYLVVSWYNQTISQLKQQIINCLLKAIPNVKGMYEKNRFDRGTLPESAFLSGQKAPAPLIVKENGVKYATYLDEGLMTGIFLDQKEVRNKLITGFARNKTVLNTFSYTGAFSVAAIVGGAKHTTSVDLAKRSLPKTKEQMVVNGIEPDNQTILVMDVFNYFNYAFKKNKTFDIVILDPPSFARNKKKTFSVAKNYTQLTTEACLLIEPKGHLIASTNAANVDLKKFKMMVENGIKETGRSFEYIETYQLPSDYVVNRYYPEGNYLKVLIYRVF